MSYNIFLKECYDDLNKKEKVGHYVYNIIFKNPYLIEFFDKKSSDLIYDQSDLAFYKIIDIDNLKEDIGKHCIKAYSPLRQKSEKIISGEISVYKEQDYEEILRKIYKNIINKFSIEMNYLVGEDYIIFSLGYLDFKIPDSPDLYSYYWLTSENFGVRQWPKSFLELTRGRNERLSIKF